MPFASKKQIEDAKAINTFDYLQAKYPGMLAKKDGEWRWTEHGSFVVTPKNGKWHWINAGFGGVNAVDFEEKVNGVPFPQSIFTVLDVRPQVGERSKNREKEPEPEAVFELPFCCRDNEQAIEYLMGRGIDLEIINRSIADGSLYESVNPIYVIDDAGHYHPKLGRNGREIVVHNVTFAGFDIEGQARFGCSRGLQGSKYRQDMTGSQKDYNFVIAAKDPECQNLVVLEACIDALSDATLKKYQAGNEGDFWYISAGGNSPLAVIQFLKDHPAVTHVYFGNDNDKAGIDGVKCMMRDILADEGLFKQVQLLMPDLPPPGMDKNKLLTEMLAQEDSWVNVKKKQIAANDRSRTGQQAAAR